jgi:hypothetical protein
VRSGAPAAAAAIATTSAAMTPTTKTSSQVGSSQIGQDRALWARPVAWRRTVLIAASGQYQATAAQADNS